MEKLTTNWQVLLYRILICGEVHCHVCLLKYTVKVPFARMFVRYYLICDARIVLVRLFAMILTRPHTKERNTNTLYRCVRFCHFKSQKIGAKSPHSALKSCIFIQLMTSNPQFDPRPLSHVFFENTRVFIAL